MIHSSGTTPTTHPHHPAMTTTKFVCYGINDRTLFRDALAYLAGTKEEAIATCQRLNPDFKINRIEACA